MTHDEPTSWSQKLLKDYIESYRPPRPDDCPGNAITKPAEPEQLHNQPSGNQPVTTEAPDVGLTADWLLSKGHVSIDGDGIVGVGCGWEWVYDTPPTPAERMKLADVMRDRWHAYWLRAMDDYAEEKRL